MDKPIVIYTDHIVNKTVCYNFAKGSDSLLCHVNNFSKRVHTCVPYPVSPLSCPNFFSPPREKQTLDISKQNIKQLSAKDRKLN